MWQLSVRCCALSERRTQPGSLSCASQLSSLSFPPRMRAHRTQSQAKLNQNGAFITLRYNASVCTPAAMAHRHVPILAPQTSLSQLHLSLADTVGPLRDTETISVVLCCHGLLVSLCFVVPVLCVNILLSFLALPLQSVCLQCRFRPRTLE